jgi:spore maturation protein SpmB
MPQVKAYSWKTIVLTVLLLAGLSYFAAVMGISHFFSTLMATAHDLLLNVVFFIMAITVLAGALGGFLAEFGILALLNKLLAPAIQLFWKLPGSAALGALTTYISDNPAIIAIARDETFISYFEDYERPALTNFGTSFGMGLVVTAFMMSQGYIKEALIGNLGAIGGSIISTRIMLHFSKKAFGIQKARQVHTRNAEYFRVRTIRDGNWFQRLLDCLLDGGKSGLEIGFQIVPGVLVICTLVLMMTFGPSDAGYTGEAYQGIPILTYLGQILSWPMKILFGFDSPDAIAFPITALGAVGAALALVPNFLEQGIIGGNEIAVFTAMGMVWSGYLSTHVAMMDSLGYRSLTSKAITAHTIGGLAAGILAHYIHMLFLS